MTRILNRVRLESLLFAGAVALSRIVFRSHAPYDLDSVNYALAIGRFDPRVYQPHPPGYFLYVLLGRLFNGVVHDPNLALVLASVAASCGAVLLIYELAREWFGPAAARFAGLLFLFSPLAWFHGTVALTYVTEAFFSALLGLVCWRMEKLGDESWSRGTRLALAGGLVLGVSAGVRPSSLVLLGPLFLYALRRVPLRARILGIGTLAAALSAWFVPMILASGGWSAYSGALESLWRLVPSKDTVFNSSPATSIARAATIGFIFVLFFGAASVAIFAGRRGLQLQDEEKKRFTAVWILPALCFFTFIFLKFVNSGYLLILSAPGCVWLGGWAANWYEGARWPRALKFAVMAVCAAANVWLFLAFPGYCSYRSVRHTEAELEDVRSSLPQVGDPQDLLIVSFDNHFQGYRQAGYALPQYVTLQYPEVQLIEGVRVFAMHGEDTRLLSGLPAGGFKRFVLCPLPAGDAGDQQFFDNVVKLLPQRDLQERKLGGHTFVTAPMRDLPLLFPRAGAQPPEGVYALLHWPAPPVYARAHPAGAARP